MHFFCDQSENTRLIVERFLETCDSTDQLFLAGASGSEYALLVKEYCHAREVDPAAVLSLEPSMLDESVLSDLMVLLSRSTTRPEVLLVRVNPAMNVVMENKLLRFMDNPAFPEAKLIVLMDGFNPFEDGVTYPENLADRCKSALFVVPPLHNRLADLAHFTVELLKSFMTERALDVPVQLSEDAMELLLEYSWPGNYAELSDVLRVLVYGSKRGGVIRREQLETAINLGRTAPLE